MVKIGEKFKLNSGGFAIVTEYVNCCEVHITTNAGYKCVVQSGDLKLGKVKDLLVPSVAGIGYLGLGGNKTGTKIHRLWLNVIRRVYNKNKTRPNYNECMVEDNWHNFQNFADWCRYNYVEGYQLDKDLKVYGNKIYSDKYCIFVPISINTFFQKRKGVNIIGVHGVCPYPNGKHSEYANILNTKKFLSVVSAKIDYWNCKYAKMILLIEKYPEFNLLLNNYFEEFFNEHY